MCSYKLSRLGELETAELSGMSSNRVVCLQRTLQSVALCAVCAFPSCFLLSRTVTHTQVGFTDTSVFDLRMFLKVTSHLYSC